jgi:hypothetical protein
MVSSAEQNEWRTALLTAVRECIQSCQSNRAALLQNGDPGQPIVSQF